MNQGFIRLEKKKKSDNTPPTTSPCGEFFLPIKWQYVLYIFYIYLYLLKAKNNGAFRNCTLPSSWKMTWGISVLHILFLHCLKLLLFLSLIYGYPGVLLTPFDVISTGNSWQIRSSLEDCTVLVFVSTSSHLLNLLKLLQRHRIASNPSPWMLQKKKKTNKNTKRMHKACQFTLSLL